MRDRKILLVDDSAQVVQALKKVLEEKGYEIETASDGIEAIAMLHEFKPDVLIVDLIMPKLQGDKLCRLVRRREGFKDLFIIVLSAIAAEKKINVKEFGGDVCIAKGPFPKLKDIVFDILRKREENPDFKGTAEVLGLDGVYRRGITSELLADKHHASVVLNNISDGIVELTGEGRVLFVNPRASVFIGESEDVLLATDFISWFDAASAEKLRKQIKLLPELEQEEPVDMVIRLGNRDMVVNMVYLEDEFGPRIITLMKDISSYKKVEEDLKTALRDKDVLLKEVHHRVKNNLAMVASLVSLEEGSVSSQADVRILEDLRSRIQSISLVHDKLYKSTDMTHLNLQEFIGDLASNIHALSRDDEGRINIECDVPEIRVNIDTAIPLAIVVSELVMNAFKYAFTDRDQSNMLQDQVVAIRMGYTDGEQCRLVVRDNGKGFGEGFMGGSGETLGWKLVESLSDQLDGTVSYRNDEGAVVTIDFPGEIFSEPV